MIYCIKISKADSRNVVSEVFEPMLIETPSSRSEVSDAEIDMVINAFQAQIPVLVHRMFGPTSSRERPLATPMPSRGAAS